MATSKLVILETSLVHAKYLKDAVSALNMEPVFIGNLNTVSVQIRDKLTEIEHHNLDMNDVDGILRSILSLKDKFEIAGITSLYDCSLELSISIANLWGVPGLDKKIVSLRDKDYVSDLIPEFSLPRWKLELNKFKKEDIEDSLRKYGKVIIKPCRGAGAVGNLTIDADFNLSKLPSMFENVHSAQYIVQPFFNGELFSVEGYCINGKSIILGFSRRTRHMMTELTNYFNLDHNLLIIHKPKMIAAISALVTRSGFMNGYFHIEFLLDENQSFLIDANFGRIAGTSFIEQFSTHFGVDPVQILRHVIDLGVFRTNFSKQNIYNSPQTIDTLSVNYGLESEAIFVSVSLPKNLRSYHTVIAKEGTLVSAIGTNDDSWIGTLAGSKEDVLKDIDEIKISTNMGIFKPFFLL